MAEMCSAPFCVACHHRHCVTLQRNHVTIVLHCCYFVVSLQEPPQPGAPSAGGRTELLSAARALLDRKASAAGKQGAHFPLLLNSSGVMVSRVYGAHFRLLLLPALGVSVLYICFAFEASVRIPHARCFLL
jgi:hypothetical protein